MLEYKEPLELLGVPGSPYTRKMLALLRYRRLAYRLIPGGRHWVGSQPERYKERPKPKVSLMPTFFGLDEKGNEQAVCDSTPLIRQFEAQFEGREVVPHCPSLAFINYVIEDYADEWITKAMFHYRWSYDEDISKAGQILPRWGNTCISDEQIAEKSAAISSLQISRLRYVGSNELTGETIESSFERFLELLDNHLKRLPFILGRRPACCDFAVFGQLTCLALFDPTPQQLIISRFPRIYAWTESMEDLSGYELLDSDWTDIDEINESDSLLGILNEIGYIYAPYLLANSAAAEKGSKQVSTELDGRGWEQDTFSYHVRCLHGIRSHFDVLTADEQSVMTAKLEKTGLLSLLESHSQG